MNEQLKDLNPEVTAQGVFVDAEALARRLIMALADAPPIAPGPTINSDGSDLFAEMMAELDENPEGEPDLLGPE